MLDNGDLLGVGCFARDITVRKENENMIKQQVTTLKEIAWMQSHEVRKPLANIMGLADLLKKQTQETTPDNQLFVYMEESCNELDSIVKKVVKYASTIDSKQVSN
jgi:nitrogen-specific signal transduction histidine kinase